MSDTSSGSESAKSSRRPRSSSSSRPTKSRPTKETFTFKTEEGKDTTIKYWQSSQRDSDNRGKWYVSVSQGEEEDSKTSDKPLSLAELKSSDNEGYNKLYKKIMRDAQEAKSRSRSRSGSKARSRSRSGSSSNSKLPARKLDRFTIGDGGKSTRVTITSAGTSEEDTKFYILEERVGKGGRPGPGGKSAGLTWDQITADDQEGTIRSRVAERMREKGRERYMPRKGGRSSSRGTSRSRGRSRSGERSSEGGKGRKARSRSRRSESSGETSGDD